MIDLSFLICLKQGLFKYRYKDCLDYLTEISGIDLFRSAEKIKTGEKRDFDYVKVVSNVYDFLLKMFSQDTVTYNELNKYNFVERLTIANIIVDKETKNILIIKRNTKEIKEDYWTFVKGGIEKGESEDEAQKREIKEEIGWHLSLDKKKYVVDTYHTFFRVKEGQKEIVKVHTKYFLVYVNAKNREIILSHEHEAYKWVKLEELEKYFKYFNDYYVIHTLKKVIGD